MSDEREPGEDSREEMDDYSGPFRPDFRLEDLSKEALVKLCRELMLAAHLLDRAIMPAILQRFGPKAMEELAIEEWRGASPVYTQRIRKAMKIEGDDVPAIFKSLQLDPGFPHEYMDVHYEVVDEKRGYFWLNSCGALADVEPWGEERVRSMCHHIEDPTFDATAQAVNPKARVRPVHRPPRDPKDRRPVCHWEVVIDDDAEPLEEAPITRIVRMSTAASFEFSPVRSSRKPAAAKEQ
jgi:hypothetical protein